MSTEVRKYQTPN